MFHSQEETLSNDENSTLRGGASVSPSASLVKPRLYARGPGKSSPLMTKRVFRKVDKRLKTSQASQKVSRLPGGGHCCIPDGKSKKRRRKKRRQFSDRLLAPTITSLAKCGALDHKQKPRRIRVKPLSEHAVSFKTPTFQVLFDARVQGTKCLLTFILADVVDTRFVIRNKSLATINHL